jgi:hypothetical protein
VTTANPYAPPGSPLELAGGPPVPKSFARRLSLILAGVGFVGFWGVGVLLASNAPSDGSEDTGTNVLYGLIGLLALTIHAVGIGIVFAAPRGRRLLPALLNAACLAIMAAVAIWAYLTDAG